MNRFLLFLLFVQFSPYLLAQTIQQRIDWGQSIRKDGIIESSKTTHNYRANGEKFEVYYKLDIGKNEGKEFPNKELFYDITGRVQMIQRFNEQDDFRDNPFHTTTYHHYDKYTLQKEFGPDLLEIKTYFYKNDKKQITEVKRIEERKTYTSKDKSSYIPGVEITKWVLKTYNSAGLLIGERSKKSETEDISKTIYSYYPQTKRIKSKKVYALNSTDKSKEGALLNSFTYSYNEQNKLTKVQDKYGSTSYQYKGDDLWVVEKKSYQTIEKNIYKDRILVRTKVYNSSSKYKHYLNKEKSLISTINYHYEYYQNELSTKSPTLTAIEQAIKKQLPAYKIFDVAKGDLNLDSKQDAIVVLEKPCDPSFDSYMSGNSFCRLIALLIQEDGLTFKVKATNKFLFECADCGGPVGDSYYKDGSIEIKKGQIQFSSIFGSCDRTYTDVIFQYQTKSKNWILKSTSGVNENCNDGASGSSYGKDYSESPPIYFKDYKSDMLWNRD